jgi:hypothetical protein
MRAYTQRMNFEDIFHRLFIEDDREPAEIREAVLAHQYRIDLARDAGRLQEDEEDVSKRRQGTKSPATLPGYSRTSEGILRGSIEGLSFSRKYA